MLEIGFSVTMSLEIDRRRLIATAFSIAFLPFWRTRDETRGRDENSRLHFSKTFGGAGLERCPRSDSFAERKGASRDREGERLNCEF